MEEGEDCDDGNDSNMDECTNDCVHARCGDGYYQNSTGELCDDGNDSNRDACTNDCKTAECGDGFTWTGKEACDDGNDNDLDGCRNDCSAARCGDGVVWQGVEECDDGNDNDNDACTNNCAWATCGDGIACTEATGPNACSTAGNGEYGAEETEGCDEGELNGAPDESNCLADCTVTTCGDGFEGIEEECDDGNTADDLVCLGDCTLPNCGDGLVNPDTEECDSGGSGALYCNSECVLNTCGDGVVCNDDSCTVENGVTPEVCDDGAAPGGGPSNLDGCLNDTDDLAEDLHCTANTCGDGYLCEDCGEVCDDGNDDHTDGCVTCVVPRSCLEIRDRLLDAGETAVTGEYVVDLDGPGGDLAPITVTCDMDTEGGGWTQITLQMARETLGGVMTAIDSAQTDGVDEAFRPFTMDAGDETHTYYYTFSFPPTFSQFYLSEYYAHTLSDGSDTSEIMGNFRQELWTVAWQRYHGDISFGSADLDGPTTSFARFLEVGEMQQGGIGGVDIELEFLGGSQVFPTDGTLPVTDAFRIGWGEGATAEYSAQSEGFYPWWRGSIYLR
ncbi:MAG: DUF4215 domain-containing protein [Myxococcales bacterium FL481]|nr:MAG: DUF4215 domain-containing protein [Myxococcales bacterium FL481]